MHTKEFFLSSLGPREFVKRTYKIADSVDKDKYYLNPLIGPGRIIAFFRLIKIIYKYTGGQKKQKVDLDAEILQDPDDPELHTLKVWGIRDCRLRDGKEPGYFPGFQEGIWSYRLENALRYGILSEQVDQFRKKLCLREENGEPDDGFFCIPQDFPV